MRSIHQEIKRLLSRVLQSETHLRLEDGSRHAKVRNTKSGDWLPIPGSPGDHRSMHNFTTALRRLAKSGRGVMCDKSGRLSEFV